MTRACSDRRASAGRSVLASVVAGAAGTVALDVVSYLDMLARGRPAGQVPSTLAARIAGAVGVGLGDRPRSTSRASALGGLLGNLTGLSVAVGYGLVRRVARPGRTLPAGLVVGVSAMAASDLPAVVAGATRPGDGWMADAVPHAAYGLATVAVYEALTSGARR